jgi:phosphatidylserine decarboxylase
MMLQKTRGIGTASMEGDSDLEDDGLSSGDEYSTDDYDVSPSASASPSRKGSQQQPVIVSPQPRYLKPSSGGILPKIMSPIRPSLSPQAHGDTTVTPEGSRPSSRARKLRPQFKRPFNSDFNFAAGANDTVGIVMLEIKGAQDLPKIKNSMSQTSPCPWQN